MMAEPHQNYCIQSVRIERIEAKIDKLDDKLETHFSPDGTIGNMSQQITRLATLIENGHKRKPPENSLLKWPWYGLVILALSVIIAALLNIDLPFIK